ncbi:unnamed protein product [Discula destructiva]
MPADKPRRPEPNPTEPTALSSVMNMPPKGPSQVNTLSGFTTLTVSTSPALPSGATAVQSPESPVVASHPILTASVLEPTVQTDTSATTPNDITASIMINISALIATILLGSIVGACILIYKKRPQWVQKACFWKRPRSNEDVPAPAPAQTPAPAPELDSAATLCPENTGHISVAPSEASSDTAVEVPSRATAIRLSRVQPSQITVSNSRARANVVAPYDVAFA